MDRNNYYGGECASLNLTQVGFSTGWFLYLSLSLMFVSSCPCYRLPTDDCTEQMYKKFKGEQKAPEDLGRDRDYNLDLVPKFIMANSELVTILTHTDVTRYLEFKQIAGSYVFREGRISKVRRMNVSGPN